MKILNASQIKATDQVTIINQKITSIDLMERASITCMHWMQKQDFVEEAEKIHIFCGMGNNGGDGLALARLLSLEFYEVEVYIVHFSDKMSDDFITNYNRLEEYHVYPISIHSEDDFPKIGASDIVVDAIFGSGLNKAPHGFTKMLIQYLNQLPNAIISIDIPSGLFIDKPVIDSQAVIKAQITLSFQLPKLAFLLPDNQYFIENFILLDINLDKDFIDNQESLYEYTLREDVYSFFKRRKKFSHKGTYGHALVMGGSFGKMGSILMTAQATLKAGAGLVTAYIPKCGYQILQTALPEAMVEVDAENELEFFNYKTKATVLAIGPGLGISEKTAQGLKAFLVNHKLPLLLDADALNILASHKELFQYLNENTILTPHPGELERLLGSWKNDYEKLEKLRQFTTDYHCVMVLKGAHTVVVQNGQFYFNSTGNPALAKGGSGDILTGIIVGLWAQGYTPLQAARLGVYLHGFTADIYAALQSPETFMPTDILNFLPGAFNHLTNPYDPAEQEFEEDDDVSPEFGDDEDIF
jgi:hydroxyethylthiazole kinase-like uncharacterized protein yjeF